MSGAATPRGDEAGRLSGARSEFVSSLPRRLELLEASLQAVEQSPGDSERLNGLLRRIHALGSSARVLGFANVAEALSEAERGLRGALASGTPLPLGDVARTFTLLPSLVAGSEAEGGAGREAFPISVLVFGPQGVADAVAGEGVSVECERTEDPTRARELARIIGPDVTIIDADRRGARELVELFVHDPLIEPVPVLVIGSFSAPEAARPFVELGAQRVLPKPVSPEALRKAVDELRQLEARPRSARAPLGELTVSALTERVTEEFRRGLLEAVEGSANLPVAFGDGTDVIAAVWSAVARVRELVTLRSQGAVRFNPTGPEGAIPLAPWSSEERRAGERLPRGQRLNDGVSLKGRRILVADDDPAVVWFMASLLKAVGAEVLEAHNGRRALELARAKWPDVVVSDVLMPELDGFSLCREIKRDVAVRDTPVILLSWKEDLLQRLRELGADADGYLRKEAAASAVVERVREVLRPRARVEQRIEAGGEVRGRLDGLTVRLLLELVCKHRRDARISVRDAVYLWELSLREGRLLSVTRSSAHGDFARGARVLPGLLGVTAGRFIIEPDSTPARAEFDGDLRAIVSEPIERARAALKAVSADSLLRIKSLSFDREGFDPYLACTPEPALGVLRRLFAAATPRDLVLSGQAEAWLVEHLLSDLARRGVLVGVEHDSGASLSAAGSAERAASVEDESGLDWDEPSDGEADVVRSRRSVRPPRKSEPEPRAEGFGASGAERAEKGEGASGAVGGSGPKSAGASAVEARAGAVGAVLPAESAPGASLADSDRPTRPANLLPDSDHPTVPRAEAPEKPTSASEPVPAERRTLGAKESADTSVHDEPTPAVDWRVGPLFAFGDEHGTLRGIGGLPLAELRREAKEPKATPAEATGRDEPPRPEAPRPEPPRPEPKAPGALSPAAPAARLATPSPAAGLTGARPAPSPAAPAATQASAPSSAAGAEGAELASLMGLTETPAPAQVAAQQAILPSKEAAREVGGEKGADLRREDETASHKAEAESLDVQAPEPKEEQAPSKKEEAPLKQAEAPLKQAESAALPPVEPKPSAPQARDALLDAVSERPAEAGEEAREGVEEKAPESDPAAGGAKAPSAVISEPPISGELIDNADVQSLPPDADIDEEEEDLEPAPAQAKRAEPKSAQAKDEPKPGEAKPKEAKPKKDFGGFWGPALGGAVSFIGVFALFKYVVLESAQEVVQRQAATAASNEAAPLAATTPARAKPSPLAPRIETFAVPEGLDTPPGLGWLQIEVPGTEPLYVDGTIIGRGPSRRTTLKPGKHQVLIGEGGDAKKVEVEITAARLTRVTLPAPSQPR